MKWLMPYLDDVFYLAGAVLICAGSWFMMPVATWFVAGAFCLHFSYLIGKARAKR